MVKKIGSLSENDFGYVYFLSVIKFIVPFLSSGQGHYCACPSSIRWTAPEILKNPNSEESDGFISLKSDTYSFGVCMWEVVTCEDPFDEVNTEQEVGFI